MYSLYLTKDGGEVLERIGKVAREQQDALLSVLNQEERDELANLLLKIADQQVLVRGVHPGYQRLGKAKALKATMHQSMAVRRTKRKSPHLEHT